MAEEQGAVPGGTPPQEPTGREQELAAELEKIRGRSRILKAVAVVAAVLVLALAAGGYYVYRRVMAVKNALELAAEGYQPAPGGSGVPEPVRAVGPVEGGGAPQVQSSLSMFSLPSAGVEEGGQSRAGADASNKAVAARTVKALSKYAGHPLVKEFLADLKNDPAYKAAGGGSAEADPLAVISRMQKSENMRGLIMKYMRRPEFPGLMQELMSDPEVAPLLSRGPGFGGRGPSLPLLPQVSGIAREPRAEKPAAVNESSDADNDGEITFNAAAVSGGSAPKYGTGAPPPPVDSGR